MNPQRLPVTDYERELVRTFPAIAPLAAICVRDVHKDLVGDETHAVLRIHLLFTIMDKEARHAADDFQSAFEHTFASDPMNFDFRHAPADAVLGDGAVCIWRRGPKIWTPAEHARARKVGQ